MDIYAIDENSNESITTSIGCLAETPAIFSNGFTTVSQIDRLIIVDIYIYDVPCLNDPTTQQ